MPNNDYIKREDIYPAVTEIAKELVFGNQDDDKVIDIINSIPSADVEPKRKTGRWNMIEDTAYCTVCGESVWIEGLGDYDPIEDFDLHYCPCCGAKMEENDGPGE